MQFLVVLLVGCGGADPATSGDADSDSDTDTISGGDCTRELPAEGDALTRVGRLSFGKKPGSAKLEAMAVASEGDRGWVCTNRWPFFSIDLPTMEPIGDPGAGDRLVCQHVAVEDGRVFVTNHGTSLDPDVALHSFSSDLVESDAVRESGVLYEGVDVDGDRLAVAEHERGLEIFEVGAGGSLTSFVVVPGFENACAVEMQDGLAYVADGAGGVKVVDTEVGVVVGSVPTTQAATEIDVDGNALVVAVSSSGTDVFRLDDPTSPTYVATVETPNTTTDVALAGGRLYTADWNEVRVFDLGGVDCQPLLLASEASNVQGDFSRTFGVDPTDDGLFVAGWETVSRYVLDPDLGGAEASLSQDVIAWGTLDEPSSTVVVLVTNEGDRDLTISGADVTGAAFSVGPLPESVAPGATAFFEATFTPAGIDPVAGEIVLHTSDPDEADLHVTLAGNAPGYGVGDALPPETEYVDVETGTHVTLGDLRGQPVLLAYFATF